MSTDSTAAQPLKRTWGSHVSRVLGTAGFRRAVAETTSVRGYYRYSPGYEVRGCNQSWEENLLTDAERDAGYVTVQHQTINSFYPGEEKRSRAEILDEKIPAYLMALEAAGFGIEERTRGTDRYLVVHGRH